mmetsp:Transcript_31726/g.79571  ORF Transcript_31726/g.79571 Transcript_31726/m.79571 type:complete len:228 (+) Transcript_31726:1306-1989(+)
MSVSAELGSCCCFFQRVCSSLRCSSASRRCNSFSPPSPLPSAPPLSLARALLISPVSSTKPPKAMPSCLGLSFTSIGAARPLPSGPRPPLPDHPMRCSRRLPTPLVYFSHEATGFGSEPAATPRPALAVLLPATPADALGASPRRLLLLLFDTDDVLELALAPMPPGGSRLPELPKPAGSEPRPAAPPPISCSGRYPANELDDEDNDEEEEELSPSSACSMDRKPRP